MLNAIIGMNTALEDALTAIVAKKSSILGFLSLIPGASSLNPVKQDLVNENASTVTLENSLVTQAPVGHGSLGTSTYIDKSNIFSLIAFSAESAHGDTYRDCRCLYHCSCGV